MSAFGSSAIVERQHNKSGLLATRTKPKSDRLPKFDPEMAVRSGALACSYCSFAIELYTCGDADTCTAAIFVHARLVRKVSAAFLKLGHQARTTRLLCAIGSVLDERLGEKLPAQPHDDVSNAKYSDVVSRWSHSAHLV